MWKKIRNAIYKSCNVMEIIMALFVVVAIVVSGVSLWKPFLEFIENRFAYEAFLSFVGYVFNILIGIEFVKMLSRPNSDTVLEVLTFLVARHMVIEKTSVVENLLSIISIGLLFAIKKYLHLSGSKDGGDIFVSEEEEADIEEKTKKNRKN